MDTPSVFLSVVIPTYNRPQRLALCLKALAELDYPCDRYEVVIVDDGSPMDLEPVVAPFRDQMTLSLIKQANAGPAKARNVGAYHAKGPFLVFTDDDCMPAVGWLTAFAQQLMLTPKAFLGGHTINALPQNLFSTASQELIDYLYQYYNEQRQKPQFFASNNIAVAKELFLALGGFDPSFPNAAGEDRELCDRWLQAGYLMKFVPTAQIQHAHHLSLRSFWKQHFYYGRGAFYFHQVRAKRQAAPIRVEPLNFYSDLLTFPLQRSCAYPWYSISILLLLSQVAVVVGFFWEQLAQRSKGSLAMANEAGLSG
ncbi:glycosyltransferase [Pseudanabaena sp. FACHB-2040]|uniref:glycosyltransferase family 2 protein n=1 Tax=Pseudanabaena sp. FACHB-2040 TaxID=2692859 RepID=UPI0016897805|nr:glycosyltransferase [Pseudanabaena sp. FACHB-2040]MBD2256137.1 glycosyltransferase [Pseudanabaena sp. FACHB-2040]